MATPIGVQSHFPTPPPAPLRLKTVGLTQTQEWDSAKNRWFHVICLNGNLIAHLPAGRATFIGTDANGQVNLYMGQVGRNLLSEVPSLRDQVSMAPYYGSSGQVRGWVVTNLATNTHITTEVGVPTVINTRH